MASFDKVPMILNLLIGILIYIVNATRLPPATVNGQSMETRGTTCGALFKEDWNYTDIHLPRNSCARAYLNWRCRTVNPYYIDLKWSTTGLSSEFEGKVEMIKVREGCKLTIYEEEDFEGKVFDIQDTSEDDIPTIGSYSCTCSPNSYTAKPKLPRPAFYPPLIDIPSSIDEVSSLMKGKLGRHIGLLSAEASLKNGRSSKNAYILVLGTTGSGKSSAINLLFANPNITNLGACMNTGIHEYRIQVPVDELGINNSELRIIDTPGLGDRVEQDAKFLATLDDYLSTHEDLHDRIPNVVLIFHKFHDNRFHGESSQYVKMLRGLDSLRGKITDNTYSNVIFVFSNFCSEKKSVQRKPMKKIILFKRVIEDYTQFPKPITITVAENKGEEEGLPMINGYAKLPNGDYYPRNLFDKIMEATGSVRDPIGNAVIRTAFRDSADFNISSSFYKIVENRNPKVLKYLWILGHSRFLPSPTEVSRLLLQTYQQMDSKLNQNFLFAVIYLQMYLNVRGIKTVADIPKTRSEILALLSSLRQNEEIIFLLQNGLGLKLPIYEQNVITGHSYNVFKDIPLSKSPYNLRNMINSDIGYLFPSAMTCNVQNKLADVFHIVSSRSEYFNLQVSDLGIEDNIVLETFTGEIKPGFNIQEEQFLNDSCSLRAVKEIRSFELTLNDRPELTPEFIKAVKSLPPFNETDQKNVNNWKEFFEEYGTHVVKSVYGGGAIVVHLKSNKVCCSDLAEALVKLLQFFEAADPIVFTNNSTHNWKPDGIQYNISFLGGDNSFDLTDFTKLSLEVVPNLLGNWKKSLRLNPAILKTEMKMLPISVVAKQVGQNFSSEIQRAASLLFKLQSKSNDIVQRTCNDLPGRDRSCIQVSTSTTIFTSLVQKIVEEFFLRVANASANTFISEHILRTPISHTPKLISPLTNLPSCMPTEKLPGDYNEPLWSDNLFGNLIQKTLEEFKR